MGVNRVVNRTTATITATSDRPKIPVLAPMAVTINPTSPREIMPHPIRRLRTQSMPEASAASPQPTSFPTTATKRQHQGPVACERTIVARETNRDKKQGNEQAVSDRIKAALHIRLVLGTQHISEQIGAGDAGYTAQPLGRNRVNQDESQNTTRNRLIGRQFAELKDQWIEPALRRAVSDNKKTPTQMLINIWTISGWLAPQGTLLQPSAGHRR